MYLPIVPLKVNNDTQTIYALLDTGSTNSFISETLADRLDLKRGRARYKVQTLSRHNNSVTTSVSLKLNSIQGGSGGQHNAVSLVNVLVVPQIPARHPLKKIDVTAYTHLRDLPLTTFGSGVQASMIIGMDNAHLLVPYGVRANPQRRNEPYATLTYFGWGLSGPVMSSGTNQVFSHCIQTSV